MRRLRGERRGRGKPRNTNRGLIGMGRIDCGSMGGGTGESDRDKGGETVTKQQKIKNKNK